MGPAVLALLQLLADLGLHACPSPQLDQEDLPLPSPPQLQVDPSPPFPHPPRLSLSVPPHVDRSQSLLAVTGGGVRCVCTTVLSDTQRKIELPQRKIKIVLYIQTLVHGSTSPKSSISRWAPSTHNFYYSHCW